MKAEIILTFSPDNFGLYHNILIAENLFYLHNDSKGMC